MTTNHIKAILTSLRAMVVKMLPAYKFYLGSTTETTTTQIGHGVMSVKDGQTQGQGALTLDDASFAGFVEGETYTAVINGVSGEYVAVVQQDVGIVISNIHDFGNIPENGWAVLFASLGSGEPYNLMYMVGGSYANATISISQTKTVTTKKYQTKKLDKSLLPDSVESGINAANAKAENAAVVARQNNKIIVADDSTVVDLTTAENSGISIVMATSDTVIIKLNPNTNVGVICSGGICTVKSPSNDIVGFIPPGVICKALRGRSAYYIANADYGSYKIVRLSGDTTPADTLSDSDPGVPVIISGSGGQYVCTGKGRNNFVGIAVRTKSRDALMQVNGKMNVDTTYYDQANNEVQGITESDVGKTVNLCTYGANLNDVLSVAKPIEATEDVRRAKIISVDTNSDGFVTSAVIWLY